MPDRLELPNFNFQYNLLSFSDLSYNLFIGAEQSEVKMLAILGDLGDVDSYGLTESIVRDIDQHPMPVSEKQKKITAKHS